MPVKFCLGFGVLLVFQNIYSTVVSDLQFLFMTSVTKKHASSKEKIPRSKGYLIANLTVYLFIPATCAFLTTPGDVGSSQCLLLFISADILTHQLSENKQRRNLTGLDISYCIGCILSIQQTEKARATNPNRSIWIILFLMTAFLFLFMQKLAVTTGANLN